MSSQHKHVANNHEIAKKVQNWCHTGQMVTNGPHQCVPQPQNMGGGCAENVKKNLKIPFASREKIS